jgi:hypothetical protein
MFSFQKFGIVSLLSSSVLICLFFFTLTATSLRAQKAREAPQGIAWEVRGPWQVEGNGAQILTGDAIQPGSLLQPGEGTAIHSITVLLPDGQRILYECFTAEDCARGFRIPSLYRTPEPFAVDLLARIHAVLADGYRDSSAGSSIQQAPRLPRDEVMAVLGPNNLVDVGGLAAKLSNGRYTYDLRPLDRAYPRQLHLVLEKTAPSITLALPSSGLYVLTITDDLNTPRIDLFIAAVKPAQAEGFEKSFGEAKALMKEWNEVYQGWPIHDFQRAYLESLMQGAKPLATGRQEALAAKLASNAGVPGGLGDTAADTAGVTAEPSFLPKPGLFDGDTAVTLRCGTPGATMHFTVDGSQPVAGSPVYRASIMVKGTGLTIKSFASMAGGKDSAVVTGIFRIRQ